MYEELDKEDQEKISKLTEYLIKGENFIEYRNIWAKNFRKEYGYSRITNVFGDMHSVYFLNCGNMNSDYYGPEIFNHDICCNYCFNGNKVKVSLYSQTPGIDCGAIARNFGGGGHPGAAGFSIPKEQIRMFE